MPCEQQHSDEAGGPEIAARRDRGALEGARRGGEFGREKLELLRRAGTRALLEFDGGGGECDAVKRTARAVEAAELQLHEILPGGKLVARLLRDGGVLQVVRARLHHEGLGLQVEVCHARAGCVQVGERVEQLVQQLCKANLLPNSIKISQKVSHYFLKNFKLYIFLINFQKYFNFSHYCLINY